MRTCRLAKRDGASRIRVSAEPFPHQSFSPCSLAGPTLFEVSTISGEDHVRLRRCPAGCSKRLSCAIAGLIDTLGGHVGQRHVLVIPSPLPRLERMGREAETRRERGGKWEKGCRSPFLSSDEATGQQEGSVSGKRSTHRVDADGTRRSSAAVSLILRTEGNQPGGRSMFWGNRLGQMLIFYDPACFTFPQERHTLRPCLRAANNC